MTGSAPRTITLTIDGPIARPQLAALCDRFCARLTASGARLVLCDVRRAAVDAVTVDALARLQLAARRHGCTVRLVHASPALRELVDLMGLPDVLPE